MLHIFYHEQSKTPVSQTWWDLPLRSKTQPSLKESQGFHVWEELHTEVSVWDQDTVYSNTTSNRVLRMNASKLRGCHLNPSRVGNSAIIKSSDKHSSSGT